jgi:predicted amidohydrolase YtcJ
MRNGLGPSPAITSPEHSVQEEKTIVKSLKSPILSLSLILHLTVLSAVFVSHGRLCSADDSSVTKTETATEIWYGGPVLACDPNFTIASALAIHGDHILAVGTKESLKGLSDESTQWHDLKGRCITPGLADSHLHFVGLGQSLQKLDLRTVANWDALIEAVVEQSKTQPAGTWITGRGWHQSKWDPLPTPNVEGYPIHDLLSERVPNHPVMLTHASGHACLANAAAMAAAGIDRETIAPDGGEIIVDSKGEPIGVFRENAQQLFSRALGRGDSQQTAADQLASVQRAVELAGQNCVEHGVTSVHDAGISFEMAEMLRQLDRSSGLPVKVYSMIREGSRKLAVRMKNFEVDSNPEGRFDVRSVKVSIDGALGPHGAWMLQPYDDLTTSAGLNTVEIDELKKIAAFCHDRNLQLCVHAIGDRANREVLDVYESILAGSERDHRWRMEHAQHIDRADLPRFAAIGVIPVMQANHCTSDALFVVERLGMRRASEGAYMWRDLIDSGCIVPNGTDAPVEPIDPRVSLHAAVTRELPNGEPFFEAQCMTRKEALWSYTLWPAIASFAESRHGSLAPGLAADFVVWDRDLYECENDALKTAVVEQTWIDGEKVFSPQ